MVSAVPLTRERRISSFSEYLASARQPAPQPQPQSFWSRRNSSNATTSSAAPSSPDVSSNHIDQVKRATSNRKDPAMSKYSQDDDDDEESDASIIKFGASPRARSNTFSPALSPPPLSDTLPHLSKNLDRRPSRTEPPSLIPLATVSNKPSSIRSNTSSTSSHGSRASSKFSFGSRRPSQGTPPLTKEAERQLQLRNSSINAASTGTEPKQSSSRLVIDSTTTSSRSTLSQIVISTGPLRLPSTLNSPCLPPSSIASSNSPLTPIITSAPLIPLPYISSGSLITNAEKLERTESHPTKQAQREKEDRDRQEAARIEFLMTKSELRWKARRESKKYREFKVGQDSPPVPALPSLRPISIMPVRSEGGPTTGAGAEMRAIDARIESEYKVRHEAHAGRSSLSPKRSLPSLIGSPQHQQHQQKDKYTTLPRRQLRRPTSLLVNSYIPSPPVSEDGDASPPILGPPISGSSILPPSPPPSASFTQKIVPFTSSLDQAFELTSLNLDPDEENFSLDRDAPARELHSDRPYPTASLAVHFSLLPLSRQRRLSSQPFQYDDVDADLQLSSDDRVEQGDDISAKALEEAIADLIEQERRSSEPHALYTSHIDPDPSELPRSSSSRLSGLILDAGSRRPSGPIALPLSPPSASNGSVKDQRRSYPRRMSKAQSMSLKEEGSILLLEDVDGQRQQRQPTRRAASTSGEQDKEVTRSRRLAHWAILFPYSMLGVLVRIGMINFLSYTGYALSGLVWAQAIGCAVFGLVIGKKQELVAIYPPLFMGLASGFACSITSLPSWIYSVFAGFTNLDSVPDRGGMEDVCNGRHLLLLLTLFISYSALSFGIYLSSLLPPTDPPSLPSPPQLSSFSISTHQTSDRHSLMLSCPPSTFRLDCITTFLSLSLYLVILLLYILLLPLDSSSTNWPATQLLYPMLLAPPGCLLRSILVQTLDPKRQGAFTDFETGVGGMVEKRYRGRRLVEWGKIMPWGTLSANLLGTVVWAVAWVLQRQDGVSACTALSSLQSGFASTLTTLPSLLLALRSPTPPSPPPPPPPLPTNSPLYHPLSSPHPPPPSSCVITSDLRPSLQSPRSSKGGPTTPTARGVYVGTTVFMSLGLMLAIVGGVEWSGNYIQGGECVRQG